MRNLKSIKLFLFKFSLIFLACLPLASCNQIGSWKNASSITLTFIDNKPYDVPLNYSLGVFTLLQYRVGNSTTISIKTQRNDYIETIETYKKVNWIIEENNK
jgi:hypothetical protein